MAPALMPLLGASRNYGYAYDHYTAEMFGVTAYSVADAKNRLPSLINKALAGEEVVITRRGNPVVELRPAARQAAPATANSRMAPRPNPTPGRASG